MAKTTEVKILKDTNPNQLENKLTNFISNNVVFRFEYSTCRNATEILYSALVLYEGEE